MINFFKTICGSGAARPFTRGDWLSTVIALLLLLMIEQTAFSRTNESPHQQKPASKENDAARIIKKTQPSNNQPSNTQPDKAPKTKRPTKSKTTTAKDKEKTAGSTAQAGKTGAANQPVVAQPKVETRVGSIFINLEFVDSDMTVLIDDEKPRALHIVSDQTIELRDIPVGSHILSITHPAIKELRRKVEVNVDGEIVHVYYRQFDMVAGRLTILSEPGAEIFVDGKIERVVPESGEVILIVPRGVRKIKAEKPGYKPSEIERDFGVEAFVLNLQLARKP